MKIEIRNRFNNSILFEGEFDNFRSAAEAAVRAGTNLFEADLRRANLRGADLRGVNLHGANLIEANLTSADLINVKGYPPEPKVHIEVISRVEDPFDRNLIVEQ